MCASEFVCSPNDRKSLKSFESLLLPYSCLVVRLNDKGATLKQPETSHKLTPGFNLTSMRTNKLLDLLTLQLAFL